MNTQRRQAGKHLALHCFASPHIKSLNPIKQTLSLSPSLSLSLFTTQHKVNSTQLTPKNPRQRTNTPRPRLYPQPACQGGSDIGVHPHIKRGKKKRDLQMFKTKSDPMSISNMHICNFVAFGPEKGTQQRKEEVQQICTQMAGKRKKQSMKQMLES